MNKISGVYKITNNITGDFYIGSSKNIKRRWADHKSPSRWKHKPNSKLYKDMAEFGLDNFKFEIIEKTDNLREREQYYIEQLKPSYNNLWAKGWNTDRYKEWNEIHRDERLAKMKEWYEIHRDEMLAYNKAYCQAHRDECLAKMKDWHKAHRDERLAKMKAYCSRLCFYEGETLTLGALSRRFCRQGIPQPTLEAKKYLIVK